MPQASKVDWRRALPPRRAYQQAEADSTGAAPGHSGLRPAMLPGYI